jgi:hypothetical protein
MNRKAILCTTAIAAGLCFSAPISGWADDSAASIAAGGLVPRRETRIVMAKEVLRISDKKVVVDYDFRNDTDQDVTTEVAFPIPPYKSEVPETLPSEQSFEKFQLWVDGKPVSYQTESKATLGDKDVTETLRADLIDIRTFGHYFGKDDSSHFFRESTPDFEKLPEKEKERLVREGLFHDTESPAYALWTVHLQYHWTQTFPAYSTVHIRHEYAPFIGFTRIDSPSEVFGALAADHLPASADSELTDQVSLLSGFCLDKSLQRTIATRLHLSETDPVEIKNLSAGVLSPRWVDFVLTSANTWKQPIEDFTLIVGRGQLWDKDRQNVVNFCTPQHALIKKLDTDHFQMHLTNFVPTSELRIGFFDLPLARPELKK